MIHPSLAVADNGASWEVRYWESIGQVGPREKWGLVSETISLLDSEAVFTQPVIYYSSQRTKLNEFPQNHLITSHSLRRQVCLMGKKVGSPTLLPSRGEEAHES